MRNIYTIDRGKRMSDGRAERCKHRIRIGGKIENPMPFQRLEASTTPAGWPSSHAAAIGDSRSGVIDSLTRFSEDAAPMDKDKRLKTKIGVTA